MIQKYIRRTLDKLTLAHFRHLLLIGGGLGCVGLVAGYLFLPDMMISGIIDGIISGYDWLAQRPFLLFAAMCILPGVGFPVSPLLFAFAAIGAPTFGLLITCVLSIAALAVNMIWSYFVSVYLFRDLFTRLFESKRNLIPDVKGGNLTFLAIIIRITPGVPFVFQNYFLGFLKMPFGQYMIVGMLALSIMTPAWVISGGALFQGNVKWFLIGISLIILISIGTNILRNKLQQNNQPPPETDAA